MWTDIIHGLGATLAYVGVGMAVIAVGYWLTDLITPGKLTALICEHNSVSAAIVAASNVLSTSIIVATAVFTTHEDFGTGLVTTAVFGLVGVALLAVTNVVLDMVTPGEYRVKAVGEGFHPASIVFASTNLGLAALIATSIS